MRCEKITSRKNPKIAAARALSDKRTRDEKGLFAVEGAKLLEELLKENAEIAALYHTERAAAHAGALIEEASRRGARVYETTDEVFEKLSGEKSPEGLFAVAKKPQVFQNVSDMPGVGTIVALDRVQDPVNVGGIIRTSAALGVERLLLSAGCADPFGPKALRASMGTVLKVRLCFCPPEDGISAQLRRLSESGAAVYGASLGQNSVDVRSVRFSPGDCLVFGSEGSGISDAVRAVCSQELIIPMRQNTESLNVAASAAILIWEMNKEVLS